MIGGCGESCSILCQVIRNYVPFRIIVSGNWAEVDHVRTDPRKRFLATLYLILLFSILTISVLLDSLCKEKLALWSCRSLSAVRWPLLWLEVQPAERYSYPLICISLVYQTPRVHIRSCTRSWFWSAHVYGCLTILMVFVEVFPSGSRMPTRLSKLYHVVRNCSSGRSEFAQKFVQICITNSLVS